MIKTERKGKTTVRTLVLLGMEVAEIARLETRESFMYEVGALGFRLVKYDWGSVYLDVSRGGMVVNILYVRWDSYTKRNGDRPRRFGSNGSIRSMIRLWVLGR
jgi:hypothetical protein